MTRYKPEMVYVNNTSVDDDEEIDEEIDEEEEEDEEEVDNEADDEEIEAVKNSTCTCHSRQSGKKSNRPTLMVPTINWQREAEKQRGEESRQVVVNRRTKGGSIPPRRIDWAAAAKSRR